ncbi:BPSL0067 family protein [Pseudoduganella violacea]|uniref:Uncharacterized protein n=1 Tax=Pseudoduganella violacea TaxID=1715466 RepID=A0A7W5BE52_9BURK|nr:BPSL0067 family protein [Pseudoduganella violacea]MBB3121263.1 hypothetical protein [Pseudoduganella violacea]
MPYILQVTEPEISAKERYANAKEIPNVLKHAAIYLSHGKNGIVALNQWNSKGRVSRRTIRFNTKSYSRSNEGTTYYVIE